MYRYGFLFLLSFFALSACEDKKSSEQYKELSFPSVEALAKADCKIFEVESLTTRPEVVSREYLLQARHDIHFLENTIRETLQFSRANTNDRLNPVKFEPDAFIRELKLSHLTVGTSNYFVFDDVGVYTVASSIDDFFDGKTVVMSGSTHTYRAGEEFLDDIQCELEIVKK